MYHFTPERAELPGKAVLANRVRREGCRALFSLLEDAKVERAGLGGCSSDSSRSRSVATFMTLKVSIGPDEDTEVGQHSKHGSLFLHQYHKVLM